MRYHNSLFLIFFLLSLLLVINLQLYSRHRPCPHQKIGAKQTLVRCGADIFEQYAVLFYSFDGLLDDSTSLPPPPAAPVTADTTSQTAADSTADDNKPNGHVNEAFQPDNENNNNGEKNILEC